MEEKGRLPHDHGQDAAGLLSVIPDKESFRKVADAFQLISDPTRLRIFWLLCHSEQCVINIAAAAGMSPPAVSHHLKTLRSGGLIRNRRIGKETYYTLADTEEAVLVHRIADEMFRMKCPAEG